MAQKEVSSETFTSTTGTTKDNAFLIDFDNIGLSDATITNYDTSTWVLKAGASKSFATGYPIQPFGVDASSTTVQIIYTF